MTSHSRVSETNNLAFGKNCLGRNCQHLSLRPNSSLKSTIVVDNDKGRQDNVDRDSKQRREQNKVLPRGKQTHTKLSPLSLESYNNIGRRQRIARQADLTSGDSKGKSHNHVVNSNVYHEAKPRHKQYQQLRNRQELAIPIHGLNQIITKRPFVSTTPQTFRKRDNHNNELKLSIGVHESVTGVGNVNLVSSGKKLDKAYKGESRYAQPQKLMSSAILFANENEIPIWLLYFLVTLVVVTIICLLASLFGCCLWLCLRFGKRGVGKSSDWSSSSSSLEPKPTKKEKKKRRDRKDKHLFDFDVESTDFDKNKNHDGRRKHLSRNMTIANLYPSNQVEKNLTLGNQSINNTNKLELYSVNWNDNHSLERINEKQLLKQNMKWLGRSNLLQKSKFKFHEQLANKRNSQNTSLDDEREESSTNIDNNINQQTIDGVKKLGSLNYKLDYDFTSSKLSVCIVRATNLAAMDLNGFSDPFVKIYLTPDKKKKYETRVHRKTLNPIFEETYQITIPYSELMTTVLVLTVCDYDRFSKNDIIGELRIPMSSVDLTQVVDEWQDLKSAKDSEDQLGQLCIGLRHVPTANKLTVLVMEARNLKKMDVAGLSDPYVKLELFINGKRLKKKKTSIKKCTLNPNFNESFTFDVPTEAIQRLELKLTVVDYDRIGTSDPIGKILLSSNAEESSSEYRHWMDMLSNPRRQITQWHALVDLHEQTQQLH